MTKSVSKGERVQISASDWNKLQELANAAGNVDLINKNPSTLRRNGQTVVKVRNVTDESLDQSAIVGLTEPIFNHDDNAQEYISRFSFDANTPSISGRIGILVGPCEPDKIVDCIVSGTAACQIDVSDENHGFAEHDALIENLVSRPVGSIQILWKAEGTGIVWAIVRIGNSHGPRWFVATTTASIDPGASGVVTADGLPADTEAKNEATQIIPADAKVGVAWDDLQNLYVVAMEFC